MKRIRIRLILAIGFLITVFMSVLLYQTHIRETEHIKLLFKQRLDMALDFDLAIRKYVTNTIRPFMLETLPEGEFIPHIMSGSYISREIFKMVQDQFSDVSIKFSSENPRNPLNQAGPDEVELIRYFNENPQKNSLERTIDINGVEYLAKVHPMRMGESCLKCHGNPADAPRKMIEIYGSERSFHFALGSVAGLDTVAIPLSSYDKIFFKVHRQNFLLIFSGLLALFLAIVFVMRFMISDRKFLAQALSRSQIEKEALMDSITDPMVYFNSTDLVVSWANSEALKIAGISKNNQLSDMKCHKIYWGTDEPCDYCPALKTFETGSNHEIETITFDGRYRLLKSFPVKDDKGRLVGVIEIANDITNFKQAEALIAKSEEKYRSILETIEDGYYEVDLSGNLVFFNDALCRILGYSRSELTGMNNRYYMSDETSRDVYQTFNGVFSTGEASKGLDVAVIHKNGTKHYIDISVTLMRDNDGNPAGFRGIARDVTEHRKAERDLAASEEKFRILAETSVDPIIQINKNGNIIYVSPSITQLAGFTVDEFMGTHFLKQFPENQIPLAVEIFYKVISGKTVRSGGLIAARKDGQLIDIEVTFSPLFQQGDIIGLQGTVRDTSEKTKYENLIKESEEKYRLIFNHVPVGIYYYDTNGIVRDSNQKALSIFDKTDHPDGDKGYNIFENEKDERVLHCVKTALSGSPCGFAGEYNSHVTGKTIHIDSYNVPIFDDDRSVKGAIVMIEDISEKVKAQKSLQESQKDLEALFDAITESILLVDPEGVILAINKTATTRVRGIADQMVGKNAFDFLAEDVAKYRKEKLTEVAHTGKPFNFEDIRYGRHVWTNYYPIVDAQGRVNRIAVFTMDTHEQKTAEKELAKFKKISDMANYGTGILTMDGRFVYVNRTFANLHGYDPGELVDQYLTILHTEDQMTHVKDLRKRLFREEGFIGEEVWHKKKNGSIFPMLMNAFVLKNENGIPQFLTVTAIDMTEIKKAEESLRESEEKYRLIFDSTPAALFYYDTNGVITDCNARAPGMMGGARDKIIGLNMFERSDHQEILACMRRSLKGDEARFEGSFTTGADQRTIHIKADYVPVYSKGKVVGGLCVGTDVTNEKIADQALKTSEEKYRRLFDNAPVGIFHYDKKGIVAETNKRTMDIFNYYYGMVPGYSVYGFDLMERLENKDVKEAVKISLSGETAHFEGPYQSDLSGRSGYLNAIFVPVVSIPGEIGGGICVFDDVSEKHLVQEELKKSHEQLRNLTKYLQTARENERTTIARELHDELGQVLTAINMEASWVAQKIPEDQTMLKPRAEAISDMAVGAIGSVKRIISELRPTLLSDLGLTAALVWQAEDYQKRVGIKFDLEIEPEEFDVDEDLGIVIFRIFQEATTNAIRHAQATAVWISLKNKGNEIELVVKDNGIGITVEKLSLNESFGIMGMRERAELVSGSLEVSGVPGKGTTLRAIFPAWR